MSLPDCIVATNKGLLFWHSGAAIEEVFSWPVTPVPDTPYLRLDGPTLQAVREALARAETWVNGAGDRPEPMLRQLRAAIKLLEGK